MKLTKNFYLSEFEASSKAKELGIDNTMPRTPFMLHNAKALAERLQLIRDASVFKSPSAGVIGLVGREYVSIGDYTV